ncbi:MAG: hypothetical protein MUQ26_01450, partial [Armatimonadetes bacterium]|nr:hypothetical protein [Armatimonadota bacterium]
MTPGRSSRGRILLLFSAAALLAVAAYWVLAASQPSPVREEMRLDGRPVTVEYADSATSEDLKLPFYPGAEIETSFVYTVETRGGVPITYYASAILVTADPPDKVAQAYRSQLPGNPEPEKIDDPSGERYVLAVAGGNEVRRVSITARDGGSRVELMRATRPDVPKSGLRP